MIEYPLKPDPDILIWFAEPRSQKEVIRLTGCSRLTIYKHMVKARRMGVIHRVGTKPGEYRGPRQRLYELTPAGVEYLEANDDGET